MESSGSVLIDERQDVEIGEGCRVEKRTAFVLGVERWDGEDAVFDVALDAVGVGDVLGVGEDHGDEFFGGEFLTVDGEAYSGAGFVVAGCDWEMTFG